MNDEIEARLERIERRLDALERRPPPVPRVPAPPVYAPPSPPEPPPRADDLESLIGARWLPRAGALAIVAALAYLVALGLQRGIVTPAMVVAGIAAACLGAAGLGLRLRGEREGFGHVLVGLGAGGLYVDAVGAHLYQNLIGSEAMVGSCLAIGLLCLGYGFGRALPAFLGIGLSGGLVAALMPLAKGGTATSAGLLLLVAAPASLVAGRRRWPNAVVGTWAACLLASLPIVYSGDIPAVRLLPLDAALLLAVGAWAWSGGRPTAFDPHGAFPFVATLAATGLALGAYPGPEGAAHVAGLAAAVGLIGLGFRDAGRQVAWAGLASALLVAPLGLSPYLAIAVLAGLASLEAAAFRRRLAPLAAVQVVLAGALYGFRLLLAYSDGRGFLPVVQEALLIALLAAAAVATAAALDRREARVVAGLAAWGLATRLGLVALGLPESASITAVWTAVCAGLFVVGFLRKRSELRQLGLAVAGATVAKVAFFDLSGLDAALKAAVLLGLGAVLLAGGYAYVRAKGNLPA